jgi:hypothetical protein
MTNMIGTMRILSKMYIPATPARKVRAVSSKGPPNKEEVASSPPGCSQGDFGVGRPTQEVQTRVTEHSAPRSLRTGCVNSFEVSPG